MENTIKETTRLLSQGILTKNEADKILLDLLDVSKYSCSYTSNTDKVKCKQLNKQETIELKRSSMTAVEWFVIELKKLNIEVTLEIEKKAVALFEQAKEMEKEQIKDAWLNAWKDSMINPLEDKYYEPEAEQYYNETFKK